MAKLPTATLLVLVCSIGWAQPAAHSPTFEVASVKPLPPAARQGNVGVLGGPGTADPTRIEYRLPMTFLVMTAYKISYFQLSGPDWINSEMYDIVAKVPPGATKEQCALMLRSLLAERFKLQIHREMKDLPMYSLVLAKNGPKLKLHVATPPPANEGKPPADVPGQVKTSASLGPGAVGIDPEGYPILRPGAHMANLGGHNRLQIENKDLVWLVEELSGQLGRPVKDETGLKGQYDFALYWLSDYLLAAAGPDSGPDLIAAVQELLGLKLEEKKGPVELIVIDHAEKTPIEN
jgi:uncharacterized protein (TIGR03435 family)